jgi:hypothetical protein
MKTIITALFLCATLTASGQTNTKTDSGVFFMPDVKPITMHDWSLNVFKKFCSKKTEPHSSCMIFVYRNETNGDCLTIDAKGKIRRHGVSANDAIRILAADQLDRHPLD